MTKARICQLLLTTVLSNREIAERTNTSHNTVGKYRETILNLGLIWPQIQKMSDSTLDGLLNPGRARLRKEFNEPDWSHIHEEMARPGVTLSLLYREYEEVTPEGAMSEREFRRRYDAYVDSLKITMRLPRLPGEQLFVDYSGKRPFLTDPVTNERRYVELWVGVVGASRKMFAIATYTQQLPDFIEANVKALEYFGALPNSLVPDNLKAAVSNVSWRDGHVINPSYQAMADHYDILVLPTRPRRPKDKPAVENGVRLAQRWILAALRNRIFHSLEEMNVAIRELLDSANARPIKGKDTRSRNQRFDDIDRPVMRPLPAERYVYAEWKIRVKVGKDYHVSFDGNWYSVPYKLVDETVDIRGTREVVQVYHSSQLVATHPRSYETGAVCTLPDHRTPKHSAYADSQFGEMTGWADGVGVSVRDFVAKHLENSTGAASVNAFRGLKQLKRRFGPDKLNKACARAILMGAISTNALQAMLLRGMESKPLNEDLQPNPVNTHENVRGAASYNDSEVNQNDQGEVVV